MAFFLKGFLAKQLFYCKNIKNCTVRASVVVEFSGIVLNFVLGKEPRMARSTVDTK